MTMLKGYVDTSTGGTTASDFDRDLEATREPGGDDVAFAKREVPCRF